MPKYTIDPDLKRRLEELGMYEKIDELEVETPSLARRFGQEFVGKTAAVAEHIPGAELAKGIGFGLAKKGIEEDAEESFKRERELQDMIVKEIRKAADTNDKKKLEQLKKLTQEHKIKSPLEETLKEAPTSKQIIASGVGLALLAATGYKPKLPSFKLASFEQQAAAKSLKSLAAMKKMEKAKGLGKAWQKVLKPAAKEAGIGAGFFGAMEAEMNKDADFNDMIKAAEMGALVGGGVSLAAKGLGTVFSVASKKLGPKISAGIERTVSGIEKTAKGKPAPTTFASETERALSMLEQAPTTKQKVAQKAMDAITSLRRAKARFIDRTASFGRLQKKAERLKGAPLEESEKIGRDIRVVNEKADALAGEINANLEKKLLPYKDIKDESTAYLLQLDAFDRLKLGNKVPGNKYKTVEEVSEAMKNFVDEMGPEKMKRLGEVRKLVQDYNNKLLQMRVDSGLISKEEVLRLQQTHPNYIPHDVILDLEEQAARRIGETYNVAKTDLMKAVGSSREIRDPFEAILGGEKNVGRTNIAMRTIEHNKLLNNFVELQEKYNLVPEMRGLITAKQVEERRLAYQELSKLRSELNNIKNTIGTANVENKAINSKILSLEKKIQNIVNEGIEEAQKLNDDTLFNILRETDDRVIAPEMGKFPRGEAAKIDISNIRRINEKSLTEIESIINKSENLSQQTKNKLIQDFKSGLANNGKITIPENITGTKLKKDLRDAISKNQKEIIDEYLKQISAPKKIKFGIADKDAKPQPKVRGKEMATETTRPAPTQRKPIKITKEFDINNQSSFDTKMAAKEAEILSELKDATRGQRFFQTDKAGYISNVTGTKSTFPKWIPKELRHKKLLDAVVEHINNGTLPKKINEVRLYDVVSERLNTFRAEISGTTTKGMTTKESNAIDDLLRGHFDDLDDIVAAPTAETAAKSKPLLTGERETIVHGEYRKILKQKFNIAKYERDLIDLEKKIDISFSNLSEKKGQISGVLDEIESLKAGKRGAEEEAISLFRNGIKETWVVPKDIAIAVKDLDPRILEGKLFNTLVKPADLLRKFSTRFNLSFTIPNLFRDKQTAALTANAFIEDLAKRAGVSPKALNLSEKEILNLYKRSGGFGASVLQDAENKAISVLTKKGVVTKLKSVNPLNIINDINSKVEMNTRLAVFRKGLERGLSAGDAAFAAREATIDFAKIGTWMRPLNRAVPFLNARVQGFINLPRAFVKSPEVFARMQLYTGVYPSMLLHQHNRRFESYKNISQSIKNRYWVVMLGETDAPDPYSGETIKVPQFTTMVKGEGQQLISNPIQWFLEKSDNLDFRSTSEMLADVLGSLSPLEFQTYDQQTSSIAVIASQFGPLATMTAGAISGKHPYFGSTIIPPDRDFPGVDKELQVKKTTPESIKEMANLIGMSPAMLDFYISAWGGLPQDVGRALDIILYNKEFSDKSITGTDFGTASRVPLIRRFLREATEYGAPEAIKERQEYQELGSEIQNKSLRLKDRAEEIFLNMTKMTTDEEKINYLNSLGDELTPELKDKIKSIKQTRQAQVGPIKKNDKVEQRAKFIFNKLEEMKNSGKSNEEMVAYLKDLEDSKILTTAVRKEIARLKKEKEEQPPTEEETAGLLKRIKQKFE